MIKPVSVSVKPNLRYKIEKFLDITTKKIRNERNFDKQYDVHIACQEELGRYLAGKINSENIFALKNNKVL